MHTAAAAQPCLPAIRVGEIPLEAEPRRWLIEDLWGAAAVGFIGDSNLYLRRENGRLMLSMEHRAAAAPDPVGLELVTTDERTIHLEVTQPVPSDSSRDQDASLEQIVLAALEGRPGMTREALRQQLAVKNQRLGLALTRLERKGRIERGCNGWQLGDARGVPRSPL